MSAFDSRTIEQLIELGDGDPRWMSDLITVFIKDAEARVSIIETTLMSDWQAASDAAHALKGSSLNMGARSLANCAHHLRHARPEDRVKLSHELVTRLHECIMEAESRFGLAHP